MENNNLMDYVTPKTEEELREIIINLESDVNDDENKKIILDEQIFLKINDILDVEYKIEEYKPQNISDELMDKLLYVANDGFGIEMGKEDVKNHIYKSENIFIMKINGEVVGFSSLSHLGDFIYRFGTVIKKKFQGNGLYKKLSKTIMNNNNNKYFLRTQNKNVIKSLEESFDNVIYGEDAYNLIIKDIDIIYIDNFLLNHGDSTETLDENGIFRGVYGGKMGEKSRVNYIDEDFCKGFSSEVGDSLLVIYFNNK